MAFEVTPSDLQAIAIGEAALDSYSESDLQVFIDAAVARAYSYVRSRYPVPLATTPTDLKFAVCQIAAFLALTHRGFDASNASDLTLQKGHDDAIAWLRDVANGRASLDVETSTPTVRSSARVYTRPLRGW